MDSLLNEVMRKKLAELARNGAKFADHGRMCGTCAFKLDSDANLEPHNVEAAWDCLAYEGQFNCHVTSGVDKGCVCAGFKYAHAAIANGLFNFKAPIHHEC
jgi:hypothetical protein